MSINMMELVRLFPNQRGINDPTVTFRTISAFAGKVQPKGIYIPLYEQGELMKAIENGAIAALWDNNTPIPAFTPNQFIIFLTDDLKKGLMNMLELYRNIWNNKLELQNEKIMTFHLLHEKDEKGMENMKDMELLIHDLEKTIGINVNRKEGI